MIAKILASISLLFVLLPMALFAQSDKAYIKYKEAELAPDPESRKEAYNDALNLYLQMESEAPSAILLFNIANTYFQLNEYGYAILYYYRALKEDPRSDMIHNNLQIALKKAGLQEESPSFIQRYPLFIHYKLSHNEKAITVLIFLFIVFALLSVNLWLPQLVLKKVAILFLSIAGILFLSLVWGDYLTTPEAIVVRSVAIRRDAGTQYATIGNPALSGTKVEVLSVEKEGHWMRVRLPSGEEGYLSKEFARII